MRPRPFFSSRSHCCIYLLQQNKRIDFHGTQTSWLPSKTAFRSGPYLGAVSSVIRCLFHHRFKPISGGFFPPLCAGAPRGAPLLTSQRLCVVSSYIFRCGRSNSLRCPLWCWLPSPGFTGPTPVLSTRSIPGEHHLSTAGPSLK